MSRTRLDLDSLDDAELLRRGIGAVRAGELDAARGLLEELLRRDPAAADGWLWLASAETEPRSKRAHFQKVLDLRPGDAEAEAGLELLAERYGRGILADDGDEPEARTCTWHPERETLLSCSRCGRPMCPACARKHPVGLRCKDCAKELRSPLYKVSAAQVLGGLALGTGAAALGALVVGFLAGRFGWISLLAAWAAGMVVGDATSRGAGRKRGRQLQVTAAAAAMLGALLLGLAIHGLGLGAFLPRVLVPGAFDLGVAAVLGAVAAYQRLR